MNPRKEKSNARRGFRERELIRRKKALEWQYEFPMEEMMDTNDNTTVVKTRRFPWWALLAVLAIVMLSSCCCLTSLGLFFPRSAIPAFVIETEAPPVVDEPVVAPPVVVETTNLVCPNTTEEAKNLFGVDVQRIATEACAWVWRGKPSSHIATCPSGYVCTWDVVNDITVVHHGIDQQADIYAGTWRLISAYPADDAVNNVCELYLKEKDFASREIPSFEVRFQPVPGVGPESCPEQ